MKHDFSGLNRPLKQMSDTEYRLAWAKDLSRDATVRGGVNWDKAKRMQGLPLFEVLIWSGIQGVYEAERIARQRMVA